MLARVNRSGNTVERLPVMMHLKAVKIGALLRLRAVRFLAFAGLIR
jgi:hypothetical protein